MCESIDCMVGMFLSRRIGSSVSVTDGTMFRFFSAFFPPSPLPSPLVLDFFNVHGGIGKVPRVVAVMSYPYTLYT